MTKLRFSRNSLLLTGFLLFSFLSAYPQDDKGKEGRSREEQLEKQEEKEKEAKKAQEEGKERHKEMQSKRTKKELRRLDRKSNDWNKGRREFFLVRWYKQIRYKIRAGGSP